MTTDRDTADMIRTAADERAAAAGMRFDAERAAFACDWIESHCVLYEGEHAGEPMILLPCWRDFFTRLYGWVRYSDEWGQWIRRFTHASFWGAKKNAKSPNCAAHNLYLLCGDGEQGQKVYQAAANGEQAKIAQLHAINMVKQSPALAADCKINNTTSQILHRPTGSILSILSGDDSRNAKAKEGLNGSVSYDEMHVVNRQIEERTSRSGISRKEPINVSFSTAGDDPSSVGYQRFAYGRQVNSGERNDPHFLHVEYGAPDKATDAEIDEHLEEYGKAANPAWGHIVRPSEFRADWQRSKGQPREVARFKQYRLNLWVGSTNQWLDTAGWEKGKIDFTLADLAGRGCYAALDLSRTRDMTSFVLIFPWPEDSRAMPPEGDSDGPAVEAVRVWPMFWLPEDTAKERDKLFPLLSWGRAGHLTLTSGGVVDYAVVKRDVRRVVREYDLKVLGFYYDTHLAEELTQQLADGERIEGGGGTVTVDGIGGERVGFPQTITAFTGPAKEFERRVAAGMVFHPGNPVLTWQVGHCEAKTDVNQNVRPVKPNPHSGKSVDGVVCCCMGMAGVMTYQEFTSVYETRGLASVYEQDETEAGAGRPGEDARPEVRPPAGGQGRSDDEAREGREARDFFDRLFDD